MMKIHSVGTSAKLLLRLSYALLYFNRLSLNAMKRNIYRSINGIRMVIEVEMFAYS